MRFVFGTAVLAAASLAVAAPASAQTQINDRGDIADATTVDWNVHFPGQSSLTSPFTVDHMGMDITVTGASEKYIAEVGWFGGFTPGDGLIFTTGSMFDISFSSLVQGFATQIWFNRQSGNNVTLTAYRGGSNIFSFVMATGGGNAVNANQATLFGLTDAVGFDRVTLEGGEEQFAFNQVTLGAPMQQVVPEPMSMILLGTGLAGLGVVRLRRRRNA